MSSDERGLEPDVLKGTSPVLRGERDGNIFDLPDFLGVDGKECGKVTGDLSATMQKIDWRDGTHIDVKEDGIPLEAVKYFSASGGSLVTAYISEQAALPRAVYYSVSAIVTIKN